MQRKQEQTKAVGRSTSRRDGDTTHAGPSVNIATRNTRSSIRVTLNDRPSTSAALNEPRTNLRRQSAATSIINQRIVTNKRAVATTTSLDSVTASTLKVAPKAHSTPNHGVAVLALNKSSSAKRRNISSSESTVPKKPRAIKRATVAVQTELRKFKTEENLGNISCVSNFFCPICYGTFWCDKDTKENNNIVAITKCGHCICSHCCSQIIVSTSTCPMCQQKFTRKGVIKIYLS